MHHLVFGINFQIHSVTLTISVSIHLLIHFSTIPFQQILPTVDFFYLLDCLTMTGLDRT